MSPDSDLIDRFVSGASAPRYNGRMAWALCSENVLWSYPDHSSTQPLGYFRDDSGAVPIDIVSRQRGKQCDEDRPVEDPIIELNPTTHLCFGRIPGLHTAKPTPQCRAQDWHQTQRYKNRRVHL